MTIKNDLYKLSDLEIIPIWLIISFTINIVFRNTYIGTALAIPVVLFIPGYVLLAALFPNKGDIKITERVVLSFALSIVVIPILGLFLNFTFGIKLINILTVLFIYTMSFVFLSSYNRRKSHNDIRFSINFGDIYETVNKGLNPKNYTDSVYNVILIFMIISTVIVIFYTITVPKIGDRLTEFYIVNSTGRADNYQIGSNSTFLVGVVNREYSSVDYIVNITLDGNILSSEKLSLDHDEKWEKNITLNIKDNIRNNNGEKKIELLLFKDNNFTVPYRELHLWVNKI